MPEIKLTVEVTEQFLVGCLTNAIESGGAALWWDDFFRLDTLERDLDLNVTSFTFTCWPTDKPSTYTMDSEKVVVGIQSLLDGTVPCSRQIVGYIAQGVKEGDAGHVDAWAADAIVQAACFGKLVFG